MADLFDWPQPNFGTEPRKLARTRDPGTSIEAATKIDSAKWERAVFDAIKSFGPTGCISDQVRKMFPAEVSYSTVTARYKALLDKKLIAEKTIDGIIQKRAGDSGRQQRILIAMEWKT